MQACSDPVAEDAGRAPLSRLGGALAVRGYEVKLLTDENGQSCLRVRNPRAAVMTERIYLQAGFFAWSWHQPVAPRDDVNAAADRIARVLRALDRGPDGA